MTKKLKIITAPYEFFAQTLYNDEQCGHFSSSYFPLLLPRHRQVSKLTLFSPVALKRVYDRGGNGRSVVSTSVPSSAG